MASTAFGGESLSQKTDWKRILWGDDWPTRRRTDMRILDCLAKGNFKDAVSELKFAWAQGLLVLGLVTVACTSPDTGVSGAAPIQDGQANFTEQQYQSAYEKEIERQLAGLNFEVNGVEAGQANVIEVSESRAVEGSPAVSSARLAKIEVTEASGVKHDNVWMVLPKGKQGEDLESKLLVLSDSERAPDGRLHTVGYLYEREEGTNIISEVLDEAGRPVVGADIWSINGEGVTAEIYFDARSSDKGTLFDAFLKMTAGEVFAEVPTMTPVSVLPGVTATFAPTVTFTPEITKTPPEPTATEAPKVGVMLSNEQIVGMSDEQVVEVARSVAGELVPAEVVRRGDGLYGDYNFVVLRNPETGMVEKVWRPVTGDVLDAIGAELDGFPLALLITDKSVIEADGIRLGLGTKIGHADHGGVLDISPNEASERLARGMYMYEAFKWWLADIAPVEHLDWGSVGKRGWVPSEFWAKWSKEQMNSFANEVVERYRIHLEETQGQGGLWLAIGTRVPSGYDYESLTHSEPGGVRVLRTPEGWNEVGFDSRSFGRIQVAGGVLTVQIEGDLDVGNGLGLSQSGKNLVDGIANSWCGVTTKIANAKCVVERVPVDK